MALTGWTESLLQALLDALDPDRDGTPSATSLEVDYSPGNYTPDAGETGDVNQHLAGIDTELGVLANINLKDPQTDGSTSPKDYYEPGVFLGDVVESMTGYPEDYGTLVTFYINHVRCFQLFTKNNGNVTYIRQFYSAWSDWALIYHADNDDNLAKLDAINTFTAIQKISTGVNTPLQLITTSSGPWGILLTRSDLSFSSGVYCNSVGWYFQHNPSIAGSTNWHSGNDGAGSGLDADTVDGLQASQLVRADQSDSMVGNYEIDGDLKIKGGGGHILLFNTADPVDTNDYNYIDRSGNNLRFYFRDNSAATSYALMLIGDDRKVTVYNDFTVDNRNRIKARYNTGNDYSANLMWDGIQFGNNGTSRIVAGNTVAGGDLEIIVNNTVDLDNQTSGHNGTISITIDNAGNVDIPNGSLSVAGDDVITTETIADYATGFKNRLINGRFDIWQRGTSQSAVGYGSADRWKVQGAGVVFTLTQTAFTIGQTSVPGNPEYYASIAITAGTATSHYLTIDQPLESVATLAGQTVTLSFYAKASTSLSCSTQFLQYFGSGGSPSGIVTAIGIEKIALTTSWARYDVTVSIPSISGKTIGTDGNDYLAVRIWLDAGSNFDASTDTLGHQTGTIDIACVQLEPGSTATGFEARPVGVELALCERYYQVLRLIYSGYVVSGNNYWLHIPYRNAMRAIPTTTHSITNVSGFTGSDADVIGNASTTSHRMAKSCNSNQSAGYYYGSVTLSAEL